MAHATNVAALYSPHTCLCRQADSGFDCLFTAVSRLMQARSEADWMETERERIARLYLAQILMFPAFAENVNFQYAYPKTPTLPVLTFLLTIAQHILHHVVSRRHIQVHELS